MVCGAVKRKNIHVQPLTTLIPMFPDYCIEGHQVQLTYCLQALKEGLNAPQTFGKFLTHASGPCEYDTKARYGGHQQCK